MKIFLLPKIWCMHILLLTPCQYYFRVGKQQLREAKIQTIDYLILLLAGACLGTLTKTSDQTFGVAGDTYTVIAVCKLKVFVINHEGSLPYIIFLCNCFGVNLCWKLICVPCNACETENEGMIFLILFVIDK